MQVVPQGGGPSAGRGDVIFQPQVLVQIHAKSIMDGKTLQRAIRDGAWAEIDQFSRTLARELASR
jgi:hypothetical protein